MKIFKTLLLIIIAATFTQVCLAQSDNVSPMDTTLYGRNKAVGKYIKTRGINLYYETYGEGEPLLIIHGNGGSINNFIYQIPYFAKSYKVILADSRAQGKSIDKADSLSYEMMTDDLNALLDTLQVNNCNVIGWSDGGINGLLLAMRHPEKVKKLAITGANLWPEATAIDPFIYKWARSYYDSLKRLPTTPYVKESIKLTRLLAFEPHITIKQLQNIKCPTLVIGGDHDVILPQHTMLIAQSIPHSYLWILPNSGHSTPIFYREIFNTEVDNFFKKPYRKIEGFGRFN
jgi:pimeloyl-ACP methyl ester carboxylesterase